ncbi:MAG: extracellular solute-binding protein, partial [Verrucomicrobiales bacterium]|nr:extracellular solute-binding protein [Verrucomicrobiales bacterium]
MKPIALFASLLLPICGFGAETLHVYTWADYVSPDVVRAFEKDHDCKVVIDTFDSNESMYARIKAGASGYDLIFPTSYMVKVMQGEGLLKELDHAALPNLKNIDPDVLSKV